jgi:thiol:disulfide interchange protein DsbG
MKKFQVLRVVCVAAGLALSLAACKDASNTTAAADAKSSETTTPVSVAAIAAQAQGFTVGSPMSARTIYVFFDPQCPHCAALWQAAKPLKSQAKFVWIPVSLLNEASKAQGAALLAAQDPVATMDEHEASMRTQQGGISAMGALDAQRALVARNTELFNRLGFGSVPTLVGNHAQTGALVTQEGSMPTAAVANLFGLQVPAATATSGQ